jgi:integrase
MAGVRTEPSERTGKYQGWYFDAQGQRKYFRGTKSKAKTLQMANRLEDEHRQVRIGYRPAPLSAKKHQSRPFIEVAQEYLAWGEAQGGRGGRPWGGTHLRNRRSHLNWWTERLGIETLADLEGVLPRVEEELRKLQRKGRSGKTISHYAEAIGALCDWGVQRGYLVDDPLKALAPFDTTPQTRRRAMTPEDIKQLLAVCVPHRRLLLETAFMSGLRANELRNLSLKHLDMERCGVHLEAEWTKNRKSGFQPLARTLVQRLHDFATSGEPGRLYGKRYKRAGTKLTAPTKPLLYVPTHTARDLDIDLEAAGIPKQTPAGKLDFHACRLAYINFVLDSGATVKEAQELARHATPEMTMNVYGRVRQDRLAGVAEGLANVIEDEKCAIVCQQQVVGSDIKSATPLDSKGLRSTEEWWRRRESNPQSGCFAE